MRLTRIDNEAKMVEVQAGDKKFLLPIHKDGAYFYLDEDIEVVCDWLREQELNEQAKWLMIEWSRESKAGCKERQNKIKAYYRSAIKWGCEYCDDRQGCMIRDGAFDLKYEGLTQIAIQNLYTCDHLRTRVIGCGRQTRRMVC